MSQWCKEFVCQEWANPVAESVVNPSTQKRVANETDVIDEHKFGWMKIVWDGEMGRNWVDRCIYAELSLNAVWMDYLFENQEHALYGISVTIAQVLLCRVSEWMRKRGWQSRGLGLSPNLRHQPSTWFCFSTKPTSRNDECCDLLKSDTVALPLSLSSSHFPLLQCADNFAISREVLLLLNRGEHSSLYALTTQPQLRPDRSLILTFPSDGAATTFGGESNMWLYFLYSRQIMHRYMCGCKEQHDACKSPRWFHCLQVFLHE